MKKLANLKQNGRLTSDLDQPIEVILGSAELQSRVHLLSAALKRTHDEADARWQALQAKEKPLRAVVDRALTRTQEYAREVSGVPLLWVGYFGAIGIDPKHLYVYFVVPLRIDAARINDSRVIDLLREKAAHELQLEGYDVSNLSPFGLYSQQECQENSGGNWYYFFK